MRMWKLVREMTVLGVLMLVLLLAGECYVRSQPNPARDKHLRMLAEARQVETLVLGSSHTYYGINPQWLEGNAYSLAMVSQSYRYDAWLLERYPFERLKNLVLPFSYFSLYEDGETGVGEHLASRYRIYMDCPLHGYFSKSNFEFMDFPAFREKLKQLYRPQRMTWNEFGWGSNYKLELRPQPWDNGEDRAAANTYADTSAVELNRRFLTSMLDWARWHGVHVFLLSTPLSRTYLENRNPEQVARNRRVLAAVLSEYPEVVYRDYEADGDFTEEDFYDADHLSDRGAEKLTGKLRRWMRVTTKRNSLPAN